MTSPTPDSPDPFIRSLQDWGRIFMRRSMRRMMRQAKTNGLSLSQLSALLHIYRGESGVSEIGKYLGVSNAAASQMLERLVQMGLVTRTEDPRDRRAKRIALTEEGCRIVEESLSARQSWLNELAESLPEAEKAKITEALQILIEKLQVEG